MYEKRGRKQEIVYSSKFIVINRLTVDGFWAASCKLMQANQELPNYELNTEAIAKATFSPSIAALTIPPA